MKKYLNKIICLVLSFTMLFSVISAADITADAYTFGTDIVEYARDYLGCKYEYAHSGPDTFDCSGFVSYVFRNFGITLPRSSRDYWYDAEEYGTVIGYNSIENAKPGDVISWYNSKAKHVAIYTGDGYVIEAANSRLGVVERQYDLKKANGDYKVIRIYGLESLGTPSNLTASGITGISVNVKWTPVEYADGYQVQLLTSAGGNWQNAGTTVTNEFNFRNLTFGHNYSVRVKAYKVKNNDKIYGDSWSHSCGFSTLTKEQAAKAIGTVDYIRFSNAVSNSADISYNAVAGANMYTIQCSSDNSNWKTVLNTGYTYAKLTGLEADSLYYVRITAYAQSGSDRALSNKYSKSYRFYTSPKGADISSLSFEDLDGYQSYSGYLAYTSVYNSYILGTNPPEYTEFSPNASITRAMFVTILYRMAESPYDDANPYEENPFTDVSEDSYYYNAACWALDNEITNQTTFKPDDSVTREQTAKFLFYFARVNDALGDAEYNSVDLSTYPDYGSVHQWAYEPLRWANYNGMITGTQQGYINPRGDTQRIHATKILYRFGKTCSVGSFE